MRARDERDRLLAELEAARQRIASLEADLRFSALSDALTGFMGVDWFRGRLGEEVERARRYYRPASLALLSVDGLTDIRADHGVEVSSDVLRATARVLRAATRTTDLMCRSGAEGFELLLPETEEPSARACVERILLELEATEVSPVRGISASVGIASLDPRTTVPELLERAERALADARAAGGGRMVSAGPLGTVSGDGAEDLNRRDAVEVLTLAMLERDRYTGEHSESVVEMAGEVSRGLGLGRAEVERVRAAALLHDIGKVGIPDAILNKPGPLTPEERDVMAEHTIIGERILRGIPGFASIASIVRHEHERWDGTGYPDGIAADAIPIGSRIILACDAYHAMTSDRPYRKRMSHEDAFEEIVKNAGTQFDPEVISALVAYFYCRRQAGEPVAG